MLQNKQAEEEEKEEGTELDPIGGKGAIQWGSKRGNLAAGEGVDTGILLRGTRTRTRRLGRVHRPRSCI